MSQIFDCKDPAELALGIDAAIRALTAGELVVLPTDTLYGVGCDAFNQAGVERVFSAKLRERNLPLPILVGASDTISGLTLTISETVRSLINAFWPGALSILVSAAPSLVWDIGGNNEKVLVRMPMDPIALELLQKVGPLAVSSANISGKTAATTVAQAEAQLGAAVEIYLDNGGSRLAMPSTIIDVTDEQLGPKILRYGAITPAQIATVLNCEAYQLIPS